MARASRERQIMDDRGGDERMGFPGGALDFQHAHWRRRSGLGTTDAHAVGHTCMPKREGRRRGAIAPHPVEIAGNLRCVNAERDTRHLIRRAEVKAVEETRLQGDAERFPGFGKPAKENDMFVRTAGRLCAVGACGGWAHDVTFGVA